MTQADDGVEQVTHSSTTVAPGGVGVAEPDHEGIRALFSDHLEGPLSSGDQRRLEDHVGGCGQCSADLATLGATVDLIGHLPTKLAPSGLKRAIVQRSRLYG